MNDETKDRVRKRQWNARLGFPWTDRHYLTDIPVDRAASDYPHAVCALGSQDRIPGGCFTHPKRGLLRRNAFRGPGWVRVAVFSVEFHTCLFLNARASASAPFPSLHKCFLFYPLCSCVYRLFLPRSNRSLMLPAGSITLTTVLVSTYPIIFTPLEARGWTLGAVALLVDFCFFFYLSFRGTLESGLFDAAYPGVTPNKSKNPPRLCRNL
jgi:hypothetical protein